MADSAHYPIAAEIPPGQRLPSPALVVVDMQNDFVRAGAPLEVPQARATIAAHRRLIAAFRSRGRPVLFTRFLSRRSGNLLWHWSPQCAPETRCCWPGHVRRYDDRDAPLPCSDIIDELAPAPDDPVVEKYGYGAFHGTGLDDLLKTLDVASLVIAGTVTQICVEETARQAFHHNYRTAIAADAVSSYAPDLHAATLKNFAMKFGWVADSDEIIGWL